MTPKGAFKFWKDIEYGVFHIGSPTRAWALCGAVIFKMPDTHPADVAEEKICRVCRNRHDQKPGAWS